MVPKEPKPSAEKYAGNGQCLDRGARLAVHHAGLIRGVCCALGAHGIRDVVATVRNGYEHCARDLRICQEVLDAFFVARRGCVNLGIIFPERRTQRDMLPVQAGIFDETTVE